ncbi:MAG: HAD family hydrolase [Nakamurella sp.]
MTGPHPTGSGRPEVDIRAYRGWLFDLDGVLTKTAEVHAAAWKQAFDGFLGQEAKRSGRTFAPFDPVDDYQRYVDGEPRADGVRHFLAARGIELPAGADGDAPDARTVAGLGNRKNDILLRVLRTSGVNVYPGAVALVKALRSRGTPTAVVSASENTKAALEAGGITELFDAVVDGHVVKQRKLAGKPASDSYLEGARALDSPPCQSVVIENALAGVEAGRAGHFGLVVGVDHHQHADQFRAHGADVVVTDLAELLGDTAAS